MTVSNTNIDNTRRKILNAALDLFSEKGFHASTTRNIAKNAGVNEVTLFRHFKTKAALFQATIEEIMQTDFNVHIFLGDLNFPLKPEDAIRLAVEAIFEIIERNPRAVRLLILALLSDVDGFEKNYVEIHRTAGLGFLTDAFKQLQEENRTSLKHTPDLLASLILSQTYEMATQLAIVKSSPLRKYDRKTLCDSILNLYIF